MKLYTMDCGWRGSIIVVANNVEEARVMMETEYNYDLENDIEEHDIVVGFIYTDLGDC